MYILNLYEVLMKRMALSRALTLHPDEEKIKVTKTQKSKNGPLHAQRLRAICLEGPALTKLRHTRAATCRRRRSRTNNWLLQVHEGGDGEDDEEYAPSIRHRSRRDVLSEY